MGIYMAFWSEEVLAALTQDLCGWRRLHNICDHVHID